MRTRFGLLFDLDGTLAETDPLHEVAWRDVLKAYGVELGARGYLERIRGRANPDIVADLLPQLSTEQGARVADEKEARFRREANALEPAPGLRELVEHAAALGWSMAVVTNAPRENAAHVLRSLGVEHALSVVIATEDVGAPKPAAEPFERGLAALGLDAASAVAFEDSVSGVRSAVAAQVRVAGLLTGHAPHELLGAGAELVAPDFTAPELRAWIDAAARAAG